MNLQKLLCEALRLRLANEKAAIPAGGELLWQWFTDLSRTRTYHMAGTNPISHQEILSYAQVKRWPIEPRHVAILRAMDTVWIEHAYSKTAKAPEGVKTLPHVSKTALSAGAFDAMFGGR